MYIKHLRSIEIPYTGNIRMGKTANFFSPMSIIGKNDCKGLLADLSKLSTPIVLLVIIHQNFPMHGM